MNGIEKIIDRISGDAQTEIDAVLARAGEEAAEIAARWEAQANTEAAGILERGTRAAGEREERLIAVARLECRKDILAAKQEVMEEAFELALKQLLELPQEDYIDLLARLALKAAPTGQGALIFSQADRARVGKAVVLAANRLGDASLTLAEETRPLKGGFILTNGAVEVNCGFEALIRLRKAELTGEVAGILFP